KVWIDQCTYWHLTKMLAGGPPDPPVTLLRALIGKKGGKPMGELRPVYEMGGSADLKPGKTTKAQPYAFVFKSAQGAELARFPFNPRATDIETRAPLEVMSFVARAPLVHGWAQLELQGPGGAVLDRKVRAEAPPEVVITAPQDGAMVAPGAGNKVKVTWTAKGGGAAPAPVLSSVLYSSDGGKIWADQAFEQPVSELEVALSPKATEHLVKVAATDGTRSSEAIIRLRTAPPPAPSPAPVKK
ncbi:MAG TPA: hypothetical protein VND93_17200, partial [Myxococcales bacterium]|nr:hypothetical protein [Myxococcales bacterium]